LASDLSQRVLQNSCQQRGISKRLERRLLGRGRALRPHQEPRNVPLRGELAGGGHANLLPKLLLELCSLIRIDQTVADSLLVTNHVDEFQSRTQGLKLRQNRRRRRLDRLRCLKSAKHPEHDPGDRESSLKAEHAAGTLG